MNRSAQEPHAQRYEGHSLPALAGGAGNSFIKRLIINILNEFVFIFYVRAYQR